MMRIRSARRARRARVAVRRDITTDRRGHTLLEILVALPLMALLGIVLVQLLLSVHRQVLHHDGSLGAIRELRQGASILTAELRGVRSSDVLAWSDTTIEFHGTVGVGIACAAGRLAGPGAMLYVAIVGDQLDAAPAGVGSDPDPLAGVWNQPPQPGDHAALFGRGAPLADSVAIHRVGVGTMSVTHDCDLSPLLGSARAPVVRLTYADLNAGASAVMIGTPVLVTRRTRFSLYRASDGDWYLGRRTWGLGGWDVVQPVVGPLASARDQGLRISVIDHAGQRVADASGHAAHVQIQLRAPRRAGRASPHAPGVATLATTVTLRADGSARP